MKKTIRRMVAELEHYATINYDVLKVMVKLGHTRFQCDAMDPFLIEDIKREHAEVLIIRSFRMIGDLDELSAFQKKLDDEGIVCISMIEDSDLRSYLHRQSMYQGSVQYE